MVQIPISSDLSRLSSLQAQIIRRAVDVQLYAIASLILLVLILTPSLESHARGLYHASKFYEYVDIFNVRASGGVIDLHFGFHHLTTPYLTFIRVVQHSEGWKPFAALNAFHHGLMYAYFGGVEFTRPVLPWTGALQLVVGILVEAWVVRERLASGQGPLWPNVASGCILSAYLVLSTRELRLRAAQAKTEAEKRAAKEVVKED
ncbi:uncharacterized protein DNG_04337 [Cephalotrichum gorgonifer]|uniref:Uncharacterized protein n=1 Tax=Cephalotrichum gorgonifer TaxID=2041049 RepID=A0AAE8SUU5_9PEZI|nr:uncharacterized protein DNG_04337 [Cephalotrichum gorgonifer]